MIYWQLFLTFFEIGAVSFGGGYGMISLIRERTLAMGWLSEGELLNLIAISESTPGPIAVNMATFVGSGQAGFFWRGGSNAGRRFAGLSRNAADRHLDPQSVEICWRAGLLVRRSPLHRCPDHGHGRHHAA